MTTEHALAKFIFAGIMASIGNFYIAMRDHKPYEAVKWFAVALVLAL